MPHKLTYDEIDRIVCDFYNEFNNKFGEQSKEPFHQSSRLANTSLANMFSSWFTDIVTSLPREDQNRILSKLKVNKALTMYL